MVRFWTCEPLDEVPLGQRYFSFLTMSKAILLDQIAEEDCPDAVALPVARIVLWTRPLAKHS